MSSRIVKLISILLCGLVLSSCSLVSVSGSYIAKYTNGFAHLQLVQLGDHEVSGELDWVTYDQDGRISTSSASVTGAVDRDSINLTFKGNGFLSGTTTGSGELGWAAITLTGDFDGGRLTTATFQKSSEADYRAALTDVQKNAGAIVRARALAEQQRQMAENLAAQEQQEAANRAALVSQVSNFSARLQKFVADANVHIGRWGASEKMMLAITDDMSKKLALEKSLTGDRNTFNRSQLSFAMGQENDNMDQFFNGLESLRQSFTGNIVPLMAQAQAAESSCASDGSADMREPCNQLAAAIASAKPKFDAVASGLDHLQSVYQEQHAKQQNIISESRSAQ